MFPLRPILLLILVGPLLAQVPAETVEARVDGIVARWLQQEERQQTDLERDLVEIGDEAASYLCDLLDGERGGAPAEPLARAVGRLGHARAPAVLGRLLESESTSERSAAVDALGALHRRDACVYLVAGAEDPDAGVRRRADGFLLADELPELWLAHAAAARLQEDGDPIRVARVLGKKAGEETHGVLVDLLESVLEANQLAALQGLYLDGRAKDVPLVTFLLAETDSVAVQKQACLVLGKIGHGSATRALIDVLYQPDKGTVANAHWALRRLTGLKLRPEPALWEEWWKRAGRRAR